MTGAERWRDNWRIVSPLGAVRVDLPLGARKRRALRVRIQRLPPDTPVVLVASAPGAASRCRSFAAAARLDLEGEYLAFPSAGAPAYLVEDHEASARHFVANVLTTPPKTAFAAPIALILAVVRVLWPSRLIRIIAPGRVAVARRR